MSITDPHVERTTAAETDCIVGDEEGLLLSAESEDETVVRTVYRVPVNAGLASCAIKEKVYPVLDLSTYGLGLEILDPREFQVGARTNGVRITFTDRVFVVDAEIVHVSPHNGDKIVCGLRVLSALDTDYADCMQRILAEMKASVFTNSPDSAA